MVTILCSESKLEFEAETKRTQQHPRIATLKAQANKDGTYREVNQALAEARKRGGYASIDEFMVLVNQIVAEAKDKTRAQHDRIAASRRREEEQRAQIKAQREARNAKLKAAGYQWSKYEPMEDMGQEMGDARWELYSPDGRLVTEQQALDEIDLVTVTMQAAMDRGATLTDAVQAGIDARQAADEAKRQAEAQRETEAAAEKTRLEQAENEAIAAFDAQVQQIETQNQRVEQIEFPVSETIRIQWPEGRQHSYYRHIDKIERGQVNGVDCWRITTGSGYDDDGYTSYYCADPTKAEASIYDTSEGSDDQDWFFG